MSVKNIIFDLGGVLVDWNPEYVFLKEFQGDRIKMKWFFDNICTSTWNEEQDGGKLMKDATEERIKLFPQYERLIKIFYGRWEEMLKDEISGTVRILYKLKNKNYKLIALTNWSAETFPIALKKYKLSSNECIMIGDRKSDMLAAKKSNIEFEYKAKISLEIQIKKIFYQFDNIKN